MKQVGKAEHEQEDWVAQDMERIGSQSGQGSLFDVAKDMVKAGQDVATHHYKKKQQDDDDDSSIQNKKNSDIAKGMIQTGKAMDWITKDMEEAGKFTTEHWFNSKLDQELRLQEERRKDVKKDIEEAGRLGSEKDLQVRADMEKTGQAHNPFETIQGFFHDISYRLNAWTEKAFHEQEEIVKDMQAAGKSTDQSWLRHDMEMTGAEGTDHGHALPMQDKELQDDLTEATHEHYVAEDMMREGKAGSGRTTRSDHNRKNLVSQDMKLVGQGGSLSEERIRQDMERAGHAEGQYVFNKAGNASAMSQYQRELQEFKSMPHARPKAPVEGKAKEPPKDQVVEPKKTESFARHLWKKARHPRTPWNEL